MLIPSKGIGDSLTSSEFNQIVSELQQIITDSGQTPNDGLLVQLTRALTLYSSVGDYYTDGGIADAYTLTAAGSRKPIQAYEDGMKIRFIAGNANTGASTVNVAGLGAKNILRRGGVALSGGDIPAGVVTELTYDSTNDRFEVVVISSGGSGIGTLRIEANTNTGNALSDFDPIPFTNEITDVENEFDGTTFTASETGLYLICGAVCSNDIDNISTHINGTRSKDLVLINEAYKPFSFMANLTATNTLTINCQQSGGSLVSTNSVYRHWLQVSKLS